MTPFGDYAQLLKTSCLGYLNLKPEQSNIFFKLMEERYRQDHYDELGV